MKIKVASSVKGRLCIPFIYGTHRANTELELTEEQMKSAEIFNLVKSGLIEVEDAAFLDNFVEYKNIGKSSINFSWGLYVKPGQSFFVDAKYTQGEEIRTFVKANAISRIINKETVLDNSKKEIPKENNKKQTKDKKPVKKKETEVDIDKISKSPEALKDVISSQKIPVDVHIHKPIESTAIVKEEQTEELGIRFVDAEQKKEKLNRLHKFIKDKSGENITQ
jgi:hypothetical protein